MKTVTLLLSSLFILSGCIAAPFIDSARRAGVTESSRMALLPEQIKSFTNKLSSGRVEPALAFVEEEARPTVVPILRNAARSEKIVEGKVEEVNFSDSAFDAEVILRVRYFKVPVYIVQDRIERQNWKFSMSDGWLLSSISQEPTPAQHAGPG